jgi:hypothetical protein
MSLQVVKGTVNVSERSVAARNTTSQSAIRNFPAKTNRSDRF